MREFKLKGLILALLVALALSLSSLQNTIEAKQLAGEVEEAQAASTASTSACTVYPQVRINQPEKVHIKSSFIHTCGDDVTVIKPDCRINYFNVIIGRGFRQVCA